MSDMAREKTVLDGVALPLAIGCLLVFALMFMLFFSSGAAPAPQPAEADAVAACQNGASQQCGLHSCTGIQYCVGGAWSECVLQRQCTPGTRAPCYESSCTAGYKVCDECGKYGKCINPPASG